MSDEDLRALRRAAEANGTTSDVLRYVDALFRTAGCRVPEPERPPGNLSVGAPGAVPPLLLEGASGLPPVSRHGQAAICFDRSRGQILMSVDGGAWQPLSSTPTLAEVLESGNATSGHSIVLSRGDRLLVEHPDGERIDYGGRPRP